MKKLLTITIVFLAIANIFAKDKRPNIIFFLADDQTRNSTGVYGNKQVKTPNMDKLANNGAIFANNYATTTICMASRASIFTGMYEYKTGSNFDKGPLFKEKFALSYPVLLRKAGYYTGFAGKFGVAITDDTVTSDQYKTWDVMPMDEFDWWAGSTGQAHYTTAAKTNHANINKYAEKYPHVTKAFGAACSDFIKDAVANGKEPFCLSMHFKAPHTPVAPDPFFDDVYKGVVWDRPPNYGIENGAHLVPQSRLGRQYTTKITANSNPNLTSYHQLIHGMDYAIGMIMKAVEEAGIADNTIIIHSSDNGFSCGAHGFGDKVLPYEEAAKTPLIIYDPRAKKANTIWREAVTANIDLAPTILEYAGVEIPENMDGKSLVKVVNDPKERVRKALPLFQGWGSLPTIAMAIVTEEYKYIYWPFAEMIPEGFELFNLKEDKYELKNVIDNPEYKPVLDDMKKYMARELVKYQKENVGRASYKELAVMYDPKVPWSEKRKNIPELFTTSYHSYPNLMQKTKKYTGDIYNYEEVMAFLNRKVTKKGKKK